MPQELIKSVFEKAPFAYAYHKLVFNEQAQPIDYIFLNTNPAFEEMTGLKKEAILGKRVTEAMPGIKNVDFDWVSFYGQMTLSGKKEEFTQHSEYLRRWYKVTAFPIDTEHFITIFQDISVDMEHMEALEKQKKEIAELLEKLETMFNEHDAVMLLSEPTTGKIIDVNPAAIRFYGYSRDELLKMHVQDINMTPKEELAKLRLIAIAKEQQNFIFPHRLKNGEIRMVDVNSCPVSHGEEQLLFSIIFDVTDREQYKEKLYLEKEILRTTLLSIGDGMVTTDKEGRITAMNVIAEEITGWKQKEAQGENFQNVFKLISEETGKEVENPVAKVLRTGKIVGLANHTALINKQGLIIPVADSAAPIRDEKGNVYGVVMVIRDVTKEKEYHEEIIRLGYHDSLTGLYNRRFVYERIKEIESQLPIAVIMGDANGLKLINDVFGHQKGDQLLKKIAHLLKTNCRVGDIIARWGGDEFLIILPQTSPKEAEEIVERIGLAANRENVSDLKISISLGFAVKERETQDFEAILKEAEDRMYQQKILISKSHRNSLLNTILSTLYEKSMETEQHGTRLKRYCRALGQEIQLSLRELDELELFAMLHDIGKISIDKAILGKPGPLSPAEWDQMKRHPEIGYRVVNNAPELSFIAEYILHHHERWDGKGYPHGLKERDIPLYCRILALADSYDAMTSDRPYRKAMSKKEALLELQRNSGTQFDPIMTDLFIQIIANHYFY